ncbi:MAG: DUF169 domain-containing protein [Candidatus Gygaella obscura]|nr:DUF169 domain-containing protein [Candidatus Gygaella obscura]
MNNINWKFADKFRSHWVKVKFYQEKPQEEAKKIKDVRFCEAVKEAITHPIILDKDSISCLGAQYAFGWNSNRKELLEECQGKTQASMANLKSTLLQSPRFKKPFKYIGLNTEGIPDILISYASPQEIMNITGLYQKYTGKNLDISLSNMMSICGGIAVKSYLEQKITISFGCIDSRNFAGLERHTVAVGIPRNLCNIFVD